MMEQIKDVQLPKVTPIRIIISGPPAAGKGTQCQRIVEKVTLVQQLTLHPDWASPAGATGSLNLCTYSLTCLNFEG